jgi:acetylornithine deacetylase/succinyl-diaminopimelate desuccinylase-like protein
MAYSPFERRRRAVARLALYSALVLTGAFSIAGLALIRQAAPAGPDTGWHGVAWTELPEVRLLQQYLRVDSSPDTGSELAAALLLATPLEAAGFEVTIERVGDHHVNLWAVLEGEDPEALVLLSHLDTEPADPAGWRHPPFAGVVEPPWIYGRGAFDMKGYTVAKLLALLELEARHPRPRRTVLFLATGGEETGSDLGLRWLLRERPELFERVWAVLTEGGLLEARGHGDFKYWATETAQTRWIQVVACAASPERLEDLRHDLWSLVSGRFDPRLTPEVARFWEIYAPTRDEELFRELLAEPQWLLRDPVALGELPPYLAHLLHDMANARLVQEASGGGWELPITLFLLPGVELEEALPRLLPPWLTHGVDLLIREEPAARRGSPLEHPVFRGIQEKLAALHPGAPSGPFVLATTRTDSRFLRHRGIPSYGFSPFTFLPIDTFTLHRVGERIALPGYVEGVEIYARVLERLATEE